MRKVVVLEHISLDGVIQAPGGPDEDTSGGFAHGGWIAPYSDPLLGAALRKQMNLPFDLLLGRKTYDIWAPYWPHHADAWPGANTATKYVASNTLSSVEWQPSVLLNGDIAEKVAKHQARARAGFARLGQRESHSDAHQARSGRCVLADDVSDHAGGWQALVCRGHAAGGVQGDGEHRHPEWRHCRELRARRRGDNR